HPYSLSPPPAPGTPRTATCEGRASRSGYAPLLVGGAAATPDLQLGSVRGDGVGVVEAFAGRWVDELPVNRLPLLVGAAVAGPQFDQGAVAEVGAGDVQAAAVNGHGAAG